MKVYEIKLFKSASPYVSKSIDDVLDHIRAEIEELAVYEDDTITISCINMTEEEYENLPDWEGP